MGQTSPGGGARNETPQVVRGLVSGEGSCPFFQVVINEQDHDDMSRDGGTSAAVILDEEEEELIRLIPRNYISSCFVLPFHASSLPCL